MNDLQVYCAATRLPESQREKFIEAICAKDPEQLERVRAQLQGKAPGADPARSAQAQSPGKNLMVRKMGDAIFVYFLNSRILDEVTIRDIGTELLSLVPQCSSHKLLLNFSAVEFMSSAMLGRIMQLHQECGKAQVDMRLCEIRPPIQKVFELMKLNKVLQIHPNEAKAMAAFAKKTPAAPR